MRRYCSALARSNAVDGTGTNTPVAATMIATDNIDSAGAESSTTTS